MEKSKFSDVGKYYFNISVLQHWLVLSQNSPRFDGASELPFAYTLYAVFLSICSKMATYLLEKYQAKNLYFQSQFP